MPGFQLEVLQVCLNHLAFGLNSIQELRFVRLFDHRFRAINILSLSFNELSYLVTFAHEANLKLLFCLFQVPYEVVLFSVGECPEAISLIEFTLFSETF